MFYFYELTLKDLSKSNNKLNFGESFRGWGLIVLSSITASNIFPDTSLWMLRPYLVNIMSDLQVIVPQEAGVVSLTITLVISLSHETLNKPNNASQILSMTWSWVFCHVPSLLLSYVLISHHCNHKLTEAIQVSYGLNILLLFELLSMICKLQSHL